MKSELIHVLKSLRVSRFVVAALCFDHAVGFAAAVNTRGPQQWFGAVFYAAVAIVMLVNAFEANSRVRELSR